MFNKYNWENYLKAGGSEVVEMFRTSMENLTEDYADKIKKLHEGFCPSKFINEGICRQLKLFYEDLCIKHDFFYLEKDNYTIQSAMDELYAYLSEENKCKPQEAFKIFCCYLEYFSTYLFMDLPDLFIPYYFAYNFNVLTKIADEFEIDLPDIPVKKDYKGRFYYYGEICGALYDFREEHGLSPYELCAFLYDFAPKFIGGIDSYIIKPEDLPEPKSAFLIGGSKDDIFLPDDVNCITTWQCSSETRAGDMIVMYMRTPVSAVDSIWRSVSVGFNDPFFWYYRCTYISQPRKIKQITQKRLKRDEIFKNLPIVRKNMQGINGVELEPSQFNHLLDIAKSDIKRIEFVTDNNSIEAVYEKDVEDKLIKPLIAKLGYDKNEWKPQLHIDVGNHNSLLIPDFVLLPVRTRGVWSAFATIEAKLTITKASELEEVKVQAGSYARQMNAQFSAIMSKEKIWIMGKEDNYCDEIFSAGWNELQQPDVFSKLYKLIGNKK